MYICVYMYNIILHSDNLENPDNIKGARNITDEVSASHK